MPAPSPIQNKTAALGRLLKEQNLYKQELADQKKKVDELKSNNGDEYELQKAERVYKDTEQMIPEMQKKIKTYLSALKNLLEEENIEEDTTDAKAKVQQAEAQLAENA